MKHMSWLLVTLLVFGFSCDQQKNYMDETQAEKQARMQWWEDARFGMFIHWGLYAVPAGEWNGQRVKGIGEWIQASLNIPREEYAKFTDQFNPQKFDADKWIKLAKKAGMKYLVVTSKHHDGFCLWDSKQTEWDVVDATPYGKDILAQLKKACKENGVRFCTYYSILDWHHPSQYVDPEADNPHAGHARNKMHEGRKQEYVDYMKAQLAEIIENYDPGVMWFDGEWVEWWTKEDGIMLYNYVRSLNPDIIINNRVGAGRQGMSGFDAGEGFAGDFGTPEQEIPDTGLAGVFWESCMTMNDTWGYKYFDDNWKSSETLIRNLVDIVSKGGNYLLNVGPRADGTIPEPSVVRLEDIGEWMTVYGESIYGSKASPFKAPAWGRYTHKPGTLYAHIFEWPTYSKLNIPLAADSVSKAFLLSDKESALEIRAEQDSTVIQLPAKAPDGIDTVLGVNYKGEL